jgi:hypothetical protein
MEKLTFLGIAHFCTVISGVPKVHNDLFFDKVIHANLYKFEILKEPTKE